LLSEGIFVLDGTSFIRARTTDSRTSTRTRYQHILDSTFRPDRVCKQYALLVAMPNIGLPTLRQATRLCAAGKPTFSKLCKRSPLTQRHSISPSIARNYVSTSRKENAQVNLGTASSAAHDDFIRQTGKAPENVAAPNVSQNADSMMDPIAGGFWINVKLHKFNANRCSQTGDRHG
jgi:hypothetical protein